jgi:hypothetical protein
MTTIAARLRARKGKTMETNEMLAELRRYANIRHSIRRGGPAVRALETAGMLVRNKAGYWLDGEFFSYDQPSMNASAAMSRRSA